MTIKRTPRQWVGLTDGPDCFPIPPTPPRGRGVRLTAIELPIPIPLEGDAGAAHSQKRNRY